MKSGLLCLLCLFGASSLAPAFERTIILPDSFGGLERLNAVALNSRTNRLYAVGERGDRIVVIDGATRERVGVVEWPTGVWPWGTYPTHAACDPAADRLYVVGDADDVLAIVDCGAESLLRVLTFEEDDLLDLCVNPVDNKLYCHGVGDSVGCLYIIDGVTGSVRARLDAPDPLEEEPPYSGLLYEPVHNRLYCVGETYEFNALIVVDGAGDSILATIDLPTFEPTCMTYDSLNDRLLCAGEADTGYAVLVIDAATLLPVDSVRLPDDEYWFISSVFNPLDGRLYLLSDDGRLLVVDVARHLLEDVVYLPDGGGLQLALHPAGRRLFCSAYFFLYVVDCPTRDIIAELDAEPLETGLAVNPNDGLALLGEYGSSRIRFVDSEGTVVGDAWTASDIGAALVDSARGRVYFANRSQDNVLVYDAATAEPLAAVPVSGTPDALCLNPKYPKLYCSSSYDALTVIDLEALAVETTFTINRDPESLYYNRATDRLYCASDRNDVLDVVDGITNELLATVPVGRNPRAMCADPDSGRLFCVSSKDDSIVVLDGRTNAVVGSIRVGKDSRSLLFHPGRRLVYCASFDSASIAVIDADSLVVVGTIRGIDRNPYLVALDPALDRLYLRTALSVEALDCATGSVAWRVPLDGTVSADLDCSTNSLFVVGDSPRRVVAIDAARGQMLCSWDTLYEPCNVAEGSCGEQLFVVSTASRVFVLDKPVLANALSSPTGPTHLKSELTLLGTRRATVHDITGRKVGDFAPGRNDLMGLPAGIYFIRREGEKQTAKVVVTR